MKRTLLDTNVYIDWLNRGAHEAYVLGLGRARILSSVVVMELRAGAPSRSEQRAVDQLVRAYEKGGRLSSPGRTVFEAAGQVLSALRLSGTDVRRASLVNDVLIALSARALGATVVTRNARDFELIRQHRDFSLEVVDSH
jgi:predicted nucleic acid-binding protein